MKKFLSFKVFFALLEELNNEQFENQLKKILEIINYKHDKELLDSFIENNKNEIEIKKYEGFGGVLKQEIVDFLYMLYYLFFINKFKELFFPQNYNLINMKFYESYYIRFHSYLKDNKEIKEYFEFCYDYLKNLKTLNNINDIHQIVLFWFNIYKNEKKIKEKIELYDYIFFNNYGNYPVNKLEQKLIWTFYGFKEKFILEGKKTKDEIFSLDMFEFITSYYLCFLYKSIFNGNKIIICNYSIKFELTKETDINKTIEDIKKILDSFIKVQKLKKNINTYIFFENSIINFKNYSDSEFKKLLEKSLEEKKINKDTIKKEKKKISNKIYAHENKKKIEELEIKLKNEKENNNNLIEKINKLEIELNIEKNKNKDLEKELLYLKGQINNKKINLKNNLKQNQPMNKELNKESKEYFELILEKDKEIKELKSKLSRYPFELLEGEKLMSVIFASIDQKIHHSIVCKNKDKFNMIENKFYEEFPEYTETENYFVVGGKKINKYKSLEDNNINNSDIILLNVIE